MAQASSSSAASAGIQSSGGNIINNPSNWGAYVIAAVAILALAVVLLKRKGKKQ